ncbi:MAG: NINE protein [Fibrobacter sp.]|nr:NINE protein [Fibrobacter sp.]
MSENNFDSLEQSFPVERKKTSKRQVPEHPLTGKIISKENSPDKNATYMGILAVLCGFLGIHDLNCGNIRNGVLKLIFSCFGFTIIISIIWNIIDLFKLGNGTYKAANGIEIGRAPWCKIAAVIELFLLVVSITAIILILWTFILGAAYSSAQYN